MSDLVTVKSATDDGKVILWERHPDHPGQEAYVAGTSPVIVALTDEVQKRIKIGALVVVQTDEPTEESASTDESTDDEVVSESKPKRKAKS